MVIPTIYRKLRTNDPPTNEETATVRRASERSLKKLRALENETALLQDRLVVLCQKKKDIEDFVENHKRLLSPVRRLHRDILQEIFYQCLPTAHNSVLDPDAPPLLLGRVCSSWREIAYSTPKLWSSLHIVIAPSPSYRGRARFQASTAWLSRSGALPLSISMFAPGKRYISIKRQISSYLNLILTHVKRWKRIHLTLLQNDWARFYHVVNTSDLPLLEVLHLEGELGRGRDPQLFDLAREGGILFSPLLHVLSLPDYPQPLLELPVQWSQLTGLNFTHSMLPLQGIINILTICSHLQVCSIAISTPDEPSFHANASTIPQIVLANLRTLKLIRESGPNHDLLTLINKLGAPKLRHFAYEQHVNQRGLPFGFLDPAVRESFRFMKSLCSFFQRLNEPLEEFDYWSDLLTRRDMMELLSVVPGLKRLSLKDFGAFPVRGVNLDELNDRFLAQFIPYEHRMRYLCNDFFDDEDKSEDADEERSFPDSICLCPNLEVLNSIEVVYSERVLLEFLRSRSLDHQNYNVSHLRYASITFKDVPKLNTKGRVRHMTKHIDKLEKDTGLLVKLKYPPVPLALPPDPPRYDDKSPYHGIYHNPVPSRYLVHQLGFIRFHL